MLAFLRLFRLLQSFRRMGLGWDIQMVLLVYQGGGRQLASLQDHKLIPRIASYVQSVLTCANVRRTAFVILGNLPSDAHDEAEQQVHTSFTMDQDLGRQYFPQLTAHSRLTSDRFSTCNANSQAKQRFISLEVFRSSMPRYMHERNASKVVLSKLDKMSIRQVLLDCRAVCSS